MAICLMYFALQVSTILRDIKNKGEGNQLETFHPAMQNGHDRFY